MVDVPHFARESLDEVRAAGVEQLLERHYEEVAFYKDIPLDPDWEGYAAIEALGRLRIFTARIGGEFVGYCVYLINCNPHYKGSLQASQDILFVLPEHRNARLGMHLILFCERSLRAEAIQVTYQHSKASEQLDMGALLERLGYELVDTIWAKRLDRS